MDALMHRCLKPYLKAQKHATIEQMHSDVFLFSIIILRNSDIISRSLGSYNISRV